MIIYDANHSGFPIADVSGQKFQGFFLKSDLSRLLEPNNCVGIRFYNAGGTGPAESQLVAAGVSEDGAEPGADEALVYFVSSPAGLPAGRINRGSAKSAVIRNFASQSSAEARRSVNFSSFFSKKMIGQLLSDKNGQAVAGISFFAATLQFTTLENGQPVTKNLRTHVGVSSLLHSDRNGADRFEILEDAANALSPARIMSDQPCPGHCVTAQTQERSATTTTGAGIDATKYLVVWEDE